MKKKPTVMTLCHRCKSNFEDAGYTLVKKGWQAVQEECDYCSTRRGFTYSLFRRKGRAANGK